MKDSSVTKPSDAPTPAERPAWRFSGRRGTPVHQRERAPSTLPEEMRTTVTQLARERAGESTTPAGATAPRSAAAASALSFGDMPRQSPPVAGAPMPVERRTRTEAAPSIVTTTPLESVPAPMPLPAPPTLVDEAPSPEDVTPITTPSSEAEAAPAIVVAPVVEAPVVEVSEPLPPAATTPDLVAPSEDSAGEESATEPKAQPVRSKQRAPLSAAERKKRARARAKARARSATPQSTPSSDETGTPETGNRRRLFARGRTVEAPASTPAPTPAPAPTPTPVALTPDLTNPPEDVTPITTPSSEAEAAPAIVVAPVVSPLAPELVAEAAHEPDASSATPEPMAETDVAPSTAPSTAPASAPVTETAVETVPTTPRVEESVQPAPEATNTIPAIEDVDLGPMPTVSPAATAFPDPSLAAELATQAAWELGRLPILLHGNPTAWAPIPVELEMVAPIDVSDAPAQIMFDDTSNDAPAVDPLPVHAPTVEPAAQLHPLQPIDWLPVSADPTPLPADERPVERPAAIAELEPGFFTRTYEARTTPMNVDHRPAAARSHEARRRVAEHRERLETLVGSLGAISASRDA